MKYIRPLIMVAIVIAFAFGITRFYHFAPWGEGPKNIQTSEFIKDLGESIDIRRGPEPAGRAADPQRRMTRHRLVLVYFFNGQDSR